MEEDEYSGEAGSSSDSDFESALSTFSNDEGDEDVIDMEVCYLQKIIKFIAIFTVGGFANAGRAAETQGLEPSGDGCKQNAREIPSQHQR